jgi:nucleotide-binding universal stress UspA family protein
MRILVPLDGSPRAAFALGPAAHLARHMVPQAEILLLRVVEDRALVAQPPDADAGVNAAIAAGGDYLRAVSMRPSLAHLRVFPPTCLATGSVAETISFQAQERRADLIVMSSKGVMGSVAQEVARLAAVPTVIVQADEDFHSPHDSYLPFTVLVALDGSLRAEAVLPAAAAIAHAMKGRVRLYHVLPEQSSDLAEERLLLEAAECYLHDVQHRLQRQGVPTEISLGRSNVAEQIIAKAHAHHADLVALATHGRTGLNRMLLGSVADTVLHQAPCPLLILRPAV